MSAARSRKILGVKFAKIEIKEENGTYHITSPYGEQHLKLTVGQDQKTPMRLENQRNPALSNAKVCNGHWKYTDYGKKLEYFQTSGVIADFAFSGTD